MASFFSKNINLVCLKQILTILMLTVLLFNWCGFQLLHSCLEWNANRRMAVQLDNRNYDESVLFTIKVPATNLSSYSHYSTTFTRIDGQIEWNGMQYNFVKRRLYNDSIEMVCIPNRTVQHLKKENNDFFTLVNDLKHPGQEKKSKTHSFRGFSDEYCAVSNAPHVFIPAGSLSVKKLHDAEALISTVSPTDEHPPQLSV